MRSYIQFISTPTADTHGTALLLHFDRKRYIIGNAHEGLQRALMDTGLKIHKVSDIFLTGKIEWKNTGGILGLILTLADSLQAAAAATAENARAALELNRSKPDKQLSQDIAATSRCSDAVTSEPERQALTLHGGPNVTHTLATGRKFIFRKGMPLEIDEITQHKKVEFAKPTWTDENILVWAMLIEPVGNSNIGSASTTQSSSKRNYDSYAADGSSIPGNPAEDAEFRDQQIRRAVIGEMFDSAWRLDALVEAKLSSVVLPAALFVRDSTTQKIVKYVGPLPGDSDYSQDVNVLVRKPWPGALVARLPPTKVSHTALSYIIRNHSQRGKFHPEKALELGVPQGRLFTELASGRSVTVTDGSIVTPEQVLGDSKPGGGFAVVELPSVDYVQSLINRPEWKVREIMEGVGAIVWILAPGLIHNPLLKDFMNANDHLEHVISSPDCCANYLSYNSSSAAAIRLNQLDADRYPIPVHNNLLSSLSENPEVRSRPHTSRVAAARGLTIQLEPAVIVRGEKSIPYLNTAQVIEQTPKDLLLLCKSIRAEISSPGEQTILQEQNLPSSDAEFVFLGTGSALPSKYRNVSATLLRVPGSGSYLFDCGENTLGQLSRVYGPDELLEVLRDLRMIWISHMHADHHLGTTSVIKAWYRAVYGEDSVLNDHSLHSEKPDFEKIADEKRLFVASSDTMLRWLEEYASVEDFGYSKIVPLNVYPTPWKSRGSSSMDWNGTPLGFKTASSKLNETMCNATGLTDLAACNVIHCSGAMGVAVTFPTGFKVAYSGDCRPTRSFVEIGKGATVLLHEATFDDELRGDAQAKGHSTTSEAIGVGIAMGARRVLLTHFSQRYQKIPVMDAVLGRKAEIELEDNLGGNGDEPLSGLDTDLPINTVAQKSLGEMIEDEAVISDLLAATPSRLKRRDSSSNGAIPSVTRIGTARSRQHNEHRLAMKQKDMKVGVAFDYMRVKVGEIALLEKFTPALIRLFNQAESEGEISGDGIDEMGKDEKGCTRKGANRKEKKVKSKGEKKKEKIGGGRMGRVTKSGREREEMRNGVDLFDDSGMGEKMAATRSR